MSGKPPSALEELREATREANAAIKDLRAVLREVAAAERSIRAAVREEADAAAEEMGPLLHELAAGTRKQMDVSSQAVIAQFDELTKFLMHGNSQGRGPDLVEEAVKNVVLRELYLLIKEAQGRGDPEALLRDMHAAAQAR